MQRPTVLALSALALSALALAPLARGQSALAVNWMGSAWSVDLETVIDAPLGATGAVPLNALTARDELVAYAGGAFVGSTMSELRVLDTVTGTLLESHRVPLPGMRALAWDAASEAVFAIVQPGGDRVVDELWRIDPATFETTLVGSTGLTGIQCMEFGPDGTLWSYENFGSTGTGLGLITLDPLTGMATDVLPNVPAQTNAQWLTVLDDGTLLIGHNSMFRVDSLTGDETPAGFIGPFDLRGLDVVPGRFFPGAYCFGDGSGAPCPCDNSASNPGGCRNSTGLGASLIRSGAPSVSSSELVLHGADLPPGLSGMFFQGTNATAGGAGIPFGDGLRCADVDVIRLEVAQSTPAGTSSTSVDVAAAGAVTSGDTRYYQLWFRDPETLCGSRFNLTNGLTVSWAP